MNASTAMLVQKYNRKKIRLTTSQRVVVCPGRWQVALTMTWTRFWLMFLFLPIVMLPEFVTLFFSPSIVLHTFPLSDKHDYWHVYCRHSKATISLFQYVIAFYSYHSGEKTKPQLCKNVPKQKWDHMFTFDLTRRLQCSCRYVMSVISRAGLSSGLYMWFWNWYLCEDKLQRSFILYIGMY